MVAKPDTKLPVDLFDILNILSGFNSAYISFYYAHLVANPHIGKAFYNLPFEHKLNIMMIWMSEMFLLLELECYVRYVTVYYALNLYHVRLELGAVAYIVIVVAIFIFK